MHTCPPPFHALRGTLRALEQRRSGDVEMSDIYVTNRKSDIYVTHLDDIYWTRETAGLALVTYLSRVLSDKYATHMCH